MIKCICIDNADRPNEIPISKWLELEKEYTITKIFNMKFQNGVLGAELKELDISEFATYNCFRLTRFGFKEQDLKALGELMVASSEINKTENGGFQDFLSSL